MTGLTEQIRHWAELARRHGQHPDSIALLESAADHIEAGYVDYPAAAHLRAWALIADSDDQSEFAEVLRSAAQALSGRPML